MITVDPIHITFTIPATDHLAREAVVGKIRFLAEHVELDWRLVGNVFRGGKGTLKKVILPYQEIEHVEMKRRWFRYRSLTLRVGDPSLVAEIPGVEMGKIVMQIDDRSREEAKRLAPMIDFKRSMFILDEQNERLEALRSEK